MMKSTGIVRKVDELGRVVIPIELRRTLGIGEKMRSKFTWTVSGSCLKNTSQLAFSAAMLRM